MLLVKNTKIISRSYAIIIIFALICTVLLGLSGCSTDSVAEVELDPKNPVTVIIWHYYHGAQKTAFDNAVKEFNQNLGYERGVIVEAVSYGGVDELAENVLAAALGELDAGNMPDIFGSYGDTALEIMKLGKVAEIDSYLTKKELEEYEESFIHEGKIGTDRLYVFPIAKSTESLMINTTDFDAFVAEVKESTGETVSYDDLATWEGILKTADIYYRHTDAKTPDIANDGKAFLGIDALANYIIVSSKQLGQDLVEAHNGSVTVNLEDEVMSKIWYTYYDAMITGRFAKLGRFCSDDIKTGDSLCYIGSTASASYFPTELTLMGNQTKRIEMAVFPMPVFDGGEKIAISQGAGMVVAKSSQEKEYASVLFLKWFTESERNVMFAMSASYLPVKQESLNENYLNNAFSELESDTSESQNSIKALRVGIEQLKNYTLYSSEVFDGSVKFRSSLTTVLNDAVQAGRLNYINLLQSGAQPEEAYSQVFEQSRDKYNEWIESLKK